MVSTRHHPRDFNTPEPTGTSKSPSPSSRGGSGGGSGGGKNGGANGWVHTPSAAITIWLVLSVPLVLWDSGYVLLRPHSMPGHKLHSPLWTPYELYGTIDYIYGWPAFNARNGFTAAQTVMNLFESAAYIYYLWVVYRYGVSAAPSSSGRAKPAKQQQKGLVWFLKDEKVVSGRVGASALLIAYSATVMTLGKTILYCECWPAASASQAPFFFFSFPW